MISRIIMIKIDLLKINFYLIVNIMYIFK